MRRTAQRDALIAEVKARQRAAGQKVSRLERQGVQVKRAGLDPRTSSPSDFNNMSSRALRSYMKQLDSFTNRSNGFVAGVQGKPISSSAFREYKRLEKKFNSMSASYEAAIGALNVPGTGQTVAQRQAMLAQGPRAGGDFRTFQQINRDAKNLTSEGALQKFIQGMQKKLDPRYLQREMAQQRRILTQMLTTSGDNDVLATVNNMDDEQLNVLVGYTSFMRDVGGRYAMAQSISSDTPRWQSQAFEFASERIQDLSQWAANLPTDIVTDDGSITSTRKRRARRVNFTPGTGTFNPDYR